MSTWWKRTPGIALVAAIALLLVGVTIALYNERAYKVREIDSITVNGQILASTVTAALIFRDRDTAREYVDAFAADPEVEAAAIYDGEGTLFAGFSRLPDRGPPGRVPAAGTYFDSDRLIVVTPVVQAGSALGAVYLRRILEPVSRRIERYAGIGLLVTMAALVLVVLGAAHAALAKANAELEKRAADLAAANRSLRVEIEQREKAEAALRQSQKMEALGRLTGGVAHDFNNLLTIVAGNLDLIDRMALTADAVPSERVRRLVAAAQGGLARGERLARQLLAFSRQHPLEARIIDINATIAEFAPFIQRAIGEAIELRLRLGGGKWLCSLDPAQFEAAILNLAINAHDATEGSGTLTIATALVAPPAQGGWPGGPMQRSQIAIDVTDTGSGMSAQTLQHIFEPFYTTKAVGKGSGLGLSQVWGFVTQSGGQISVDSAPGRGTAFRLLLPLSDAVAAEDEAEPSALSAQHGSETILVVEDEDEVREVVAATLAGLGYDILGARDGREALSLLNDRPDIDLLFTDYVMPNGLNGVELAQQAVRIRHGLKVLLTTGYARPAAAGAADAGFGGLAMIAKPYRAGELAQRIRRILDGDVTKKTRAESPPA